MVKNLRQVLVESFASIYFLTDRDKRFISSFGSAGKPVSLEEFLKFWDSLDDVDKADILLNYYPDEHPGTEGFKE
jgi:hypothetical protein